MDRFGTISTIMVRKVKVAKGRRGSVSKCKNSPFDVASSPAITSAFFRYVGKLERFVVRHAKQLLIRLDWKRQGEQIGQKLKHIEISGCEMSFYDIIWHEKQLDALEQYTLQPRA